MQLGHLKSAFDNIHLVMTQQVKEVKDKMNAGLDFTY